MSFRLVTFGVFQSLFAISSRPPRSVCTTSRSWGGVTLRSSAASVSSSGCSRPAKGERSDRALDRANSSSGPRGLLSIRIRVSHSAPSSLIKVFQSYFFHVSSILEVHQSTFALALCRPTRSAALGLAGGFHTLFLQASFSCFVRRLRVHLIMANSGSDQNSVAVQLSSQRIELVSNLQSLLDTSVLQFAGI